MNTFLEVVSEISLFVDNPVNFACVASWKWFEQLSSCPGIFVNSSVKLINNSDVELFELVKGLEPCESYTG